MNLIRKLFIAGCLAIATLTFGAAIVDPPPIAIEAAAVVGSTIGAFAVLAAVAIMALLVILSRPTAEDRVQMLEAERQRRRAVEEAEFQHRMEHDGPTVDQYFTPRRTRFDPGRVAGAANIA